MRDETIRGTTLLYKSALDPLTRITPALPTWFQQRGSGKNFHTSPLPAPTISGSLKAFWNVLFSVITFFNLILHLWYHIHTKKANMSHYHLWAI